MATNVSIAVPLSFGSQPDIVFSGAPLALVLCQIRFPPVFALLADSGVAGFQEALRREYPITGRVDGIDLVTSPQAIKASQPAPVWKMSTADEQWVVSVAVDFVALETPRYTHFADFQGRMERVLDALHRTVHPAASTRVGLRKINQIRDSSVATAHDWAGLLKAPLLGLLSNRVSEGQVELSMTDFRLRDENGDELGVRHGVLPDEHTTYVLDLDYSTLRPYEVAPDSGLSDLLKGFSDSTTDFFMWCLEKPLYTALGPGPRPAEEL